MPGPNLKVADFVHASKSYVHKSVEVANQDGNAYLTKEEAKALPKDLRDNFEAHRVGGQKNRRASARKFEAKYVGYVGAMSDRADLDKNGRLEGREVGRLPKDLKDNFTNYYHATNTLHRVGSYVARTPGELLSTLEKKVARHAWREALPLFDLENRKGQHEIGVNDFQYLAEGMGLHMVDNQLPGPVTREDTLNLIESIRINRAVAEVHPQFRRYTGTATLEDGSTRKVEVFMKKVDGGYVFDPPVG